MPPTPQTSFVFDTGAWTSAAPELPFMAAERDASRTAAHRMRAKAAPENFEGWVSPNDALPGIPGSNRTSAATPAADAGMKRTNSSPSLASRRGSAVGNGKATSERGLHRRADEAPRASSRPSSAAGRRGSGKRNRRREISGLMQRQSTFHSAADSATDQATDPTPRCALHPQVRLRSGRCPRCAAEEMKTQRNGLEKRGSIGTDVRESSEKTDAGSAGQRCPEAEGDHAPNEGVVASEDASTSVDEESETEEVPLDEKWAEALRNISRRLAESRQLGYEKLQKAYSGGVRAPAEGEPRPSQRTHPDGPKAPDRTTEEAAEAADCISPDSGDGEDDDGSVSRPSVAGKAPGAKRIFGKISRRLSVPRRLSHGKLRKLDPEGVGAPAEEDHRPLQSTYPDGPKAPEWTTEEAAETADRFSLDPGDGEVGDGDIPRPSIAGNPLAAVRIFAQSEGRMTKRTARCDGRSEDLPISDSTNIEDAGATAGNCAYSACGSDSSTTSSLSSDYTMETRSTLMTPRLKSFASMHCAGTNETYRSSDSVMSRKFGKHYHSNEEQPPREDEYDDDFDDDFQSTFRSDAITMQHSEKKMAAPETRMSDAVASNDAISQPPPVWEGAPSFSNDVGMSEGPPAAAEERVRSISRSNYARRNESGIENYVTDGIGEGESNSASGRGAVASTSPRQIHPSGEIYDGGPANASLTSETTEPSPKTHQPSFFAALVQNSRSRSRSRPRSRSNMRNEKPSEDISEESDETTAVENLYETAASGPRPALFSASANDSRSCSRPRSRRSASRPKSRGRNAVGSRATSRPKSRGRNPFGSRRAAETERSTEGEDDNDGEPAVASFTSKTAESSPKAHQPSFFAALVQNSRSLSLSRPRSRSKARNEKPAKDFPEDGDETIAAETPSKTASVSQPTLSSALANNSRSRSCPRSCRSTSRSKLRGHNTAGSCGVAKAESSTEDEDKNDFQVTPQAVMDKRPVNYVQHTAPVSNTNRPKESLHSLPDRGPITYPHYKLGDVARDEDMITFLAPLVQNSRSRSRSRPHSRSKPRNVKLGEDISENGDETIAAEFLSKTAAPGPQPALFSASANNSRPCSRPRSHRSPDRPESRGRNAIGLRGEVKAEQSIEDEDEKELHMTTQQETDKRPVNHAYLTAPVSNTSPPKESLHFPSPNRGPITHPHYKLGDVARNEDMIIFPKPKSRHRRGRKGRRSRNRSGSRGSSSSSDSEVEDFEKYGSKHSIQLAISQLCHLDAAFVRRSDGGWTYALVADGDDKQIRFVVNSKGSTKSVPKSQWRTCVRRIRALTPRRGDRFAVDRERRPRWRRLGGSRGSRGGGGGRGRLVSPSPTRRISGVLNLPPTILEHRDYNNG